MILHVCFYSFHLNINKLSYDISIKSGIKKNIYKKEKLAFMVKKY